MPSQKHVNRGVAWDVYTLKKSPASTTIAQNVHEPNHRDEVIITRPEQTVDQVCIADANYACGSCENDYRSERCSLPQHIEDALFQSTGESLREFTVADVRYYQDLLVNRQLFRSEMDLDAIYNAMSGVTNKLTGVSDQLLNQLDHLSTMIKVLNDSAFVDSVNFDARYLADLTSQAFMALQLLSAQPTAKNLLIVFTCILTKLDLSKEKLAKCVDFIQESVRSMLVSIGTLGYKSESWVPCSVEVLKGMCQGAGDLLDDRIVEIVFAFLAKLIGFWTTVSGGFTEDDFLPDRIPQVVGKIREIKGSGGDLIECLLGTYEWVVKNFPLFLRGDFSGLFFGKAETGAFESRTVKVTRAHKLVTSGLSEILKEEYNHTFASYDAEVDTLIRMGDRMMLKAKPAQRPALKRMLDELREIQVDRRIKQAQIQTKPTAMGVCFVGDSGVGKSLLMESTSRAIICAAGEHGSADNIVTGQMSDKFDSNELPHHLSIQYDDVANNSHNENFDKLLNAVNSQARPFLKAAVEDKGVMFPGNVACVISTNVPGLNARKSNCPDSIARRFLHIHVRIKEELIPEVCVPGTRRVDPIRSCAGGAPRMDIWDFDVYEFITFDINEDEEPEDGVVLWENMYVRPLHWTDKPMSERTFWDLSLYLTRRAKKHFASQEVMVKQMIARQQEEFCVECCIPRSVCVCACQSEFRCAMVDAGIERLVEQYGVYHALYEQWWSFYRWRAALSLAVTLAPCDYIRNGKVSVVVAIGVATVCRMPLEQSVLLCLLVVIFVFVVLVALSWRTLYVQVRNRVGILTHLAESSVEMMNQHRIRIFAGISMVSFAYLLYRSFRPRSELASYAETLPENLRNAFARHEKARTTPVDNILPHIKRDLGTLIVKSASRETMVLTFPIEANFYITAGHAIPKDGEFEVTIIHENALTPTVAKQRLSSAHVYRFPDKDLVLLQIPSAVPRRGYRDYLLAKPASLPSTPVNIVSMRLEDKTRYVSATLLSPGWSMLSPRVSTDLVTLYKPYKYEAPQGTHDGMCGSVIVDFSKAIIYGFHVAGNGRVGLCDTITGQEIDVALSRFRGFVPVNQGDLQMGSHALSRELGFVTLEVGDPALDKPPSEHNCLTEGVIPGQGAKFIDPYVRHPFKDSIVGEFGPPTHFPPFKPNAPEHKRKALSRLTTPNQEFTLDELEFAAHDYLEPIVSCIKRMSPDKREELARPLTLAEALDGTGERALGGIDNSTSVGFPFRGKKKTFLERDVLDPTLPAIPRKLTPVGGVSIEDEMQEMLVRYRSGISCRPLFKCSMKTDELLPTDSKKARVFMGSNFPFLLLCRQYLAPVVRMAAHHRFMFESAKGINMDSIECEDLFYFLKVEEGERIVALDYQAYDQTMSAQASSTAAGVIITILREVGCSEDHILIARGLLTDIIYPNLHFFGTILQLANSDPSGNWITTELNGLVNSLYLRVFFFRIYAELRGKVKYRDAVHTMTFGDDNINGVYGRYSRFNGTNIVAEGEKCGLVITMADKSSEISDFTSIFDSDFLKRKFRYCSDLGHIRAPLLKSSIEKTVHWMKKSSPDKPEAIFAQTVDGMLRKSSQHGRAYFEDIRAKLLNIATVHECVPLCKWWTYNELIAHDRQEYYDHYRQVSIYDIAAEAELRDFLSEAKRKGEPPSLLLLMVRLLLMTGGVVIVSIEFTNWYADGGRDAMIGGVIKQIRAVKARAGAALAEPLAFDGIKGVAEQYHIPEWVARILVSLFKPDFTSESLDLPFRSEAFVNPPPTSTLWGRLMTWILEWFIAIFPFVSTGRYAEIGMNAFMYSWGATILTTLQTTTMFGSLPLFERVSLAKYGHQLKHLLVKHWLRDSNEIIRRQSYGVLLEGYAGVGKTTLALALVKHLIPNIRKEDIIVLNEDDEFQSELRSNHRVIILDDVLNTRNEWVTVSPMRRVIDMINNVPRRALSPEAELKGNVKIEPELVILTTNVSVSLLLSFTWCPDSLTRRWRYVQVSKVAPFKTPGIDTTAWRFYVPERQVQNGNSIIEPYNRVNMIPKDEGGNQDLCTTTFDGLLKLCGAEFEAQRVEQTQLVESVNALFKAPSLWDWIYPPPEYKSEGLDWDSALLGKVSRVGAQTPEEFLAAMVVCSRELVAENGEQAFDEVPHRYKSPPPPETWWQWFLTQILWYRFVSEARKTPKTRTIDSPRQEGLDDSRLASVRRARSHIVVDEHADPNRGYLIEPEYVVEFRGRIAIRIIPTARGSVSILARQAQLFSYLVCEQINYSASPNYVSATDLFAFFEQEDIAKLMRSESRDVSANPLSSYIDVFGEEVLVGFLGQWRTELFEYAATTKHDTPPGVISSGDDTIYSALDDSPLSDGFIKQDLRDLLEVRGIGVEIGSVPSRWEQAAQDRVIGLLPDNQLVGREIILKCAGERISCDLVFVKGNTYRFIEAKGKKTAAVKEQAKLRKNFLLRHLKGMATWYGYYSLSESKLQQV